MEQVIIKGKIMAINNLPYTNSLMPNMQAQTQQASMPGITGAGQFPTPAQPPNPTAQAPWTPPTYQANPNQQFVSYNQQDQYHGQPIDPIRAAIGRSMMFNTSPTWAHNLPANAVPHPMAQAPQAPPMQPMPQLPPMSGSPGPSGQWVGPDGKPAGGIDPGFFTGNRFVPDQTQGPRPPGNWMGQLGSMIPQNAGPGWQGPASSNNKIPRTGRKGPGYGTSSYQKGK